MENLTKEKKKELKIKINKKKAHEIYLIDFFYFEILFLILYKIMIGISLSILLTTNSNISFLIINFIIFFIIKFILGIICFFSYLKKDKKFTKLFYFENSIALLCITFFFGLYFNFEKKNYQIVFFLFNFLGFISLLIIFDYFSNKKNLFSMFFFFFYFYQLVSNSIFFFKFDNIKSFDWSLNFFNLSIFPTIIIFLIQILKVIYYFTSRKIFLPKIIFFCFSYLFFYITNIYMIENDHIDETPRILYLKFMIFLFFNFYLSYRLYFIENYINWINLEKNIEYSLIFKNSKFIKKLNLIQKSHNYFKYETHQNSNSEEKIISDDNKFKRVTKNSQFNKNPTLTEKKKNNLNKTFKNNDNQNEKNLYKSIEEISENSLDENQNNEPEKNLKKQIKEKNSNKNLSTKLINNNEKIVCKILNENLNKKNPKKKEKIKEKYPIEYLNKNLKLINQKTLNKKKLKNLTNEKKKKFENHLAKINIENCFICFSKPIEIICEPCLHSICCQDCFIDFFKIKKFHCIFCKKKIMSGIRFRCDEEKNLFFRIGSFKIIEQFSDYFLQ